MQLFFQLLSYPKTKYVAYKNFWATTSLSQRILLLLIVITATLYLGFSCFYTESELLKLKNHSTLPYHHLLVDWQKFKKRSPIHILSFWGRFFFTFLLLLVSIFRFAFLFKHLETRTFAPQLLYLPQSHSSDHSMLQPILQSCPSCLLAFWEFCGWE